MGAEHGWRRHRLVEWLVARQGDGDGDGDGGGDRHDEDCDEEDIDDESSHGSTYGGFNGRIGKPKDSCYSFWCGASLAVSGVERGSAGVERLSLASFGGLLGSLC